MIRRKKWFTGLLGVVAVGMVSASSAWACTGGLFSDADMTLSPNFGDCAPTAYPNSCPGNSVSVSGSGFVNDDTTAIASVQLYWLDTPFFLAGLGGPGHEGQQADGQICGTKGVALGGSRTVTSGSFTATVTVPPSNSTYADNTPRLIKAYYGANAICAVWSHTTSSGTHTSGVGNQYTLYPL